MNSRGSRKNAWADHYTRKARKEHFPARSIYKLQEIQQKTGVIQKGHAVLDLGCAPGSWLMYAAELTGPSGKVVGVDLTPVSLSLPPHVRTVAGDALDTGPLMREIGDGYDVVLSDMAPKTTGNHSTDSARSYYLCESALIIAQQVLKSGGGFVCKIFQGEDFGAFIDRVKSVFAAHKIFKPQSSRKASKEIFVIGLNKR